jgi:peptide methionine sulfoxide reductase msrA/msrB
MSRIFKSIYIFLAAALMPALGAGVSAAEKEAVVFKIVKSDDEWKKILTPEQYKITRQGGTECAFTGKYWDFKGKGVFKCVCCGIPLFKTDEKFESGTGWPSFTAPFSKDSVVSLTDSGHGMVRTEIRCAACGAHLGHVFNDGPAPGGQRYCINSAALVFEPEKKAAANPVKTEKACFGAGCFWGVEEYFRKLDGVTGTTVGYMGGSMKNPSYKDVCTDKTGHAEVLLIEFDPSKISYGQLLGHFWKMHNPTTLNRQGPDHGTQYRSVIFCYGPEQKKEAEASKDALQKSGKYKNPVVTEIVPAGEFWRAEEYHQRYHQKHGGPSCGI